jgi:hypothetical protein
MALKEERHDEEWFNRVAKRLKELGVVKISPRGVRLTDRFFLSIFDFIYWWKRSGGNSDLGIDDDDDLALIVTGALFKHCRVMHEEDLYDAADLIITLLSAEECADNEG